MDPTRFDTLSRSLVQRTAAPTRRSVLATLAASLGALGSPLIPAQAKRKKKKCKGGKLKCSGGCIDPQTDFANCGTCGNVCGGGQTCDGGTCVDGGGGGGGGACDPPCGFNTVCADGTCVAAADICSGPTGICDADPTPCGTSATGETCGCEQTVEGNNVCVDGANPCPNVVECTSSQDCRDTLGFHFYCQEAKRSQQFPGQFCGCGFGTATGRVCVAECDNPDVAFANTTRKRKQRGRRTGQHHQRTRRSRLAALRRGADPPPVPPRPPRRAGGRSRGLLMGSEE